MDKLYGPHDLFAELRKIITNLPEFVVALDVHLEANEIPVAIVKTHIYGDDGTPTVKDDEVVTETKTFRIVPPEDVYIELLATFKGLEREASRLKRESEETQRAVDELRKTISDPEALKWAIDLLESHAGVQANLNSQYWLRRLCALVPGYRALPPLTPEQLQEAGAT